MRSSLVAAALLAAAALGSPAFADGMPEGVRAHGGPSPHRSWQGARAHPGSIAREAAGYGPPPPALSHHGPVGPMLVEYREPYLPRGVLYNVPPPPSWAVGYRGYAVRALN